LASKAIENAAIDPETIDYIILHNFDVKRGTSQSDTLPSLATVLKINYKKTQSVLPTISFGCPGWIEGVLQANATSNQNGATLFSYWF
jgi:3-oxoacyl-[acyl-carrier-protein] synthase-3